MGLDMDLLEHGLPLGTDPNHSFRRLQRYLRPGLRHQPKVRLLSKRLAQLTTGQTNLQLTTKPAVLLHMPFNFSAYLLCVQCRVWLRFGRPMCHTN